MRVTLTQEEIDTTVWAILVAMETVDDPEAVVKLIKLRKRLRKYASN